MPVFGATRLERFFRLAAELDVDKDDLKRFSDFVERKLHDLLLIGQATASANLRDLVEPSAEQVNLFSLMEWAGLAIISIIGIAWLVVLWRRSARGDRVASPIPVAPSPSGAGR